MPHELIPGLEPAIGPELLAVAPDLPGGEPLQPHRQGRVAIPGGIKRPNPVAGRHPRPGIKRVAGPNPIAIAMAPV